MNPREWQQGCKKRDATRKCITTCSRLVGAVALASQMEGWACARGDMQAHGRLCVGATTVCPKVIHNWRVLWYSIPCINRRELLLKLFVASLQAHRDKGGSDETWRMQFTFLGQHVCRDALYLLTGITPYLLNQARDAALKGHRSVLSVREMGMHACMHQKPKQGTRVPLRTAVVGELRLHSRRDESHELQGIPPFWAHCVLLVPVPKRHFGTAWVSHGPQAI